jgi:hypothetical protein
MERRKAVVAAATVAGTLLAASSAYAFTSGIVDGGSPDDGAGNLSPVLEEEAPPIGAPTGPGVTVTGDDRRGADPASPTGDDDDRLDDLDDHDGDEVDHDEDGEHEDEGEEEHEYEGREDDD